MYYHFHFKDVCIADQCRKLEFGPEKAFQEKRLINHTIRTIEITVSKFCPTVSALIFIHGEMEMETMNVN